MVHVYVYCQLRAQQKYGLHCADFHENHKCVQTSYPEFYQNRSRHVESAGANSFTPLKCGMTVTEAIFTLAVQKFVKDSHAEFREHFSNDLLANTKSRTDGRTWCPHKPLFLLRKGRLRRSRWPRGLRRRSAATRLLRLGVRIPLGAGCLSVTSVVFCQVEVSVSD